MSETHVDNTSESDEDVLTTESFFMTCKMVGLTLEDLDMMTIGECLDYVENYVDIKSGKQEEKTRRATQDDFDSF
ncbi:hypothetical protein [Oceanobacillus alkalisoli]|nr:hypothetical protein [Oceanobacillus alkalisoli]